MLFMHHVCPYYTVLSVPCSLVKGWPLGDLLVVVSLSHIVAGVRCGTGLYPSPIFAYFFNFNTVGILRYNLY